MSRADSTLASLHIHLLGGCSIEVNRRSVNARRKARSLIALLALQPHHQMHREQIVEWFWRGQEPEWAINNLHKTIHAARRALEPDVSSGSASAFIRSNEQRIVLSAPGELRVDVDEFERLAALSLKDARGGVELCESALALYAGDLLPEEPYEDWIVERREGLISLRQQLLARLASLYEESRQFDKSLALYEQLALSDKSNEAAHRGLMRLYALAGNRREAMKRYELCRAYLRKELDVTPEGETVNLYERIAAGELREEAAGRGERAAETASGASPKTNLRHQLTSFIGRVDEINGIKRHLASSRLVTLTGTGGIGKTRLAFEVASGLQGEYADGVWLVELAMLKDPLLVEHSVASVLGVREERGYSPLENLRRHLCVRRMLLIIDNCEHVIEAVAALSTDLLGACPEVHILATSREAIGIPGELVRRVSTLALPESDTRASAASLALYESTQLFLERAALSDSGWRVTDESAPAVAELCRRLEGIPLALELAAARIKALSVHQILSMLDDNLRLLSNTERAVAPRHRTIRAAIEWSYELLSGSEQVLYRELCVFAGGCTLAAAEAVSTRRDNAGGSIIDLLSRLIDKSLVMVEHRKSEARYRFLETIRQYGLNRLRESGEDDEVCARHLDWCLQLAGQAARAQSGAEQQNLFTVLENEHDNLRAALQWSLSEGHDAERGLELCVGLWRYWQTHGHVSEGRRSFESALRLSLPVVSPLRADALHGASALASLQGDFAHARALLEACLALRREMHDKRGESHATQRLGILAYYVGDYQQAAMLQERSLSLCREIGDRHGEARAIGGLGILALDHGDFEHAWSRFQECLSIYQGEDYRLGIAVTTNNLGETALRRGDLESAERLLKQSLKIAEELGDKGWIARSCYLLGHVNLTRNLHSQAVAHFNGALTILRESGDAIIVHVLEGFACVAAAQGQAGRALLLSEAAVALRRVTKMARTPVEQKVIDCYLNGLGASLHPEEVKKSQETGRTFTLDMAIDYALQTTPRS
jgi:predicted ATPase/DNA-binding SARP family transcriptional activator